MPRLAQAGWTPAGCYLSGILVEPAWRGRGIATSLTRGRLLGRQLDPDDYTFKCLVPE